MKPDKLPVPIKPDEFRHGSPIPEPVTEKAGHNEPIAVADLIDKGVAYSIECPECTASAGSACLLHANDDTTFRKWPHSWRVEVALKRKENL